MVVALGIVLIAFAAWLSWRLSPQRFRRMLSRMTEAEVDAEYERRMARIGVVTEAAERRRQEARR